jgi:hypothetical protein
MQSIRNLVAVILSAVFFQSASQAGVIRFDFNAHNFLPISPDSPYAVPAPEKNLSGSIWFSADHFGAEDIAIVAADVTINGYTFLPSEIGYLALPLNQGYQFGGIKNVALNDNPGSVVGGTHDFWIMGFVAVNASMLYSSGNGSSGWAWSTEDYDYSYTDVPEPDALLTYALAMAGLVVTRARNTRLV